MNPFPYQDVCLSEIREQFASKDRVCLQLNTAGGKTVIFSFLTQWWLSNHASNVLILCHRKELITQTERTLNTIGIGSEPIIPTSKIKHHSRVYIAMVETANNRLKKNHLFFKNIGLVIVDECHILVFQKTFSYFPSAKILGCTATPCVLKRITFWKCPYCRTNHEHPTICCDEEVQEWSRPFTLSEIYEDIVIGASIQELIEFGSVVPEISFIKHYTDDTVLKVDSDGEYTKESVESEYGNDNAVFNVLLNYKELCEGKKTIIFNPSSKSNLSVYKKFIEAGYTNVRMFDSVNKAESGDRSELLHWFDQTPDAVLLNVGVFTTGFDSREVQAILLNRPTGSLSLFIQIAGRGGRSSNKIFKDHFILVDGGGNIDRFGEWSSPNRDWRKIFFEGTGKEKAKKSNALNIQECPECGYLYEKAEPCCPECGYVIPPKTPKEKSESNEVNAPIRKIPPPNGERIYIYTISKNENINFAFKIMIGQIIDLFRYYRVTPEIYEKTKNNGELDKKVSRMIRSCYFVLLKKQDIQTEGRRTLSELLNRTKKQLDIYYGSRKSDSATGTNVVHKHVLPETSLTETINV